MHLLTFFGSYLLILIFIYNSIFFISFLSNVRSRFVKKVYVLATCICLRMLFRVSGDGCGRDRLFFGGGFHRRRLLRLGDLFAFSMLSSNTLYTFHQFSPSKKNSNLTKPIPI